MIRAALSLTAVAALAAVAAAQEPGLPKGPPPKLMVLTGGEGATFITTQQITEQVPEERQREVEVNGRKQLVTVTVMVSRPRTVEVTMRLGNAQAFTANGKRVDPAELAKRLKGPTLVLVSADGKMVDPFYLRVLREDALVLVPNQGRVSVPSVPLPPPLPANKLPPLPPPGNPQK
jgi:hypothetical protein